MSEKELEILQYIQYALDNVGSIDFGDFEVDDIQGLLDLYQTKTEQLETALNSLKKEKEKCKEFEEERKQFYDGEIYTVNQLKNIEKTTHKYWIHKSKIKEIIYPTPTNPISYEIQTSDMYKKLEQLLEEE